MLLLTWIKWNLNTLRHMDCHIFRFALHFAGLVILHQSRHNNIALCTMAFVKEVCYRRCMSIMERIIYP
jgi:hypothetical protein